MSIVLPTMPLVVQKPAESLPEHKKFENNGEWYLQNALWYVLNYFNTYSSPSGTNTGIGNTIYGGGGLISANGNPVGNSGSRGITDEMLDNYNYFYGVQDNRIFNAMTSNINNQPLPTPFIKGQEVRELCDHMIGKIVEMVNPIEDNISAETISQNSLLKRKEIFDKIDLAGKIGGMLESLGGGVKFAPAGDIDYSSPQAIEEAKQKIRDEYSATATVIARNAYYKNQLKDMFVNAGADSIICNLAGIEFGCKNGKMTSNYIPGYQAIYDYSTWGQYGEGQRLGGYIQPVTLEQALQEYPDMPKQWSDEMEEVLYTGADGSKDFMNYYNQPFRNVLWWYNDQKWMSKAVVYWIGECDSRYYTKKNGYGLVKTKRIDDYKDYYDPAVGNTNMPAGSQMKKGYDIKGDFKVLRVHKAVVLGAKYLVEYGYDDYQVRPFGDKQTPEIPIKFFCYGKMAGYVKSIVSRLKPKQDELDAVRYRIREYTANDLGFNIFVNGGKLTEDFSVLNLISDLKSTHVTVLPSTGEAGERSSMNDLVSTFTNNATAAINQYLVLKADIEKEMRDIVNITEASLGESKYLGKGAMDTTIGRSELSSMPFYSSLFEYYRRVLAYAANKNKMILLDNKDKNVVLPISNREIKMLEITEDFNYEDLNVYLSPDDNLKTQELGMLNQYLQSYNQAPTVDGAEAILNSLKIMRSKSFIEGVVVFENYIEKKKKEIEQKQQQGVMLQQQQEQYANMSAQIAQSQAEMAKLTTELAKINLKGSWGLKTEEVKAGLEQASKIDDQYIAQITDLVSRQLGQVNAQQGQAMQPQGGQVSQATQGGQPNQM